MSGLVARYGAIALLLAACSGGGTAETTVAATVPRPPVDAEPCSLLSVDEAATLMGEGLTLGERPGLCRYQAATGDLLVEIIDAPGGTEDLAELRRSVEDAFGSISVRTLEDVGEAGYLVDLGSVVRIRFAVGMTIVTLAISLGDSVPADLVTRAEEMARVVAGRI